VFGYLGRLPVKALKRAAAAGLEDAFPANSSVETVRGPGILILHSRFRGCALGLEKRCDAIQSPSSTSWTKLPKHFYSVWVLNNQDNEGPCISVLFLSWPPCSPSPTFHLPRSSNFPSRQRIRPLISPRSGPDAFAPGLSRDYNKPLLSASIAKHALAFSQSISFPSPF
jgi:hypothetical protein